MYLGTIRECQLYGRNRPLCLFCWYRDNNIKWPQRENTRRLPRQCSVYHERNTCTAKHIREDSLKIVLEFSRFGVVCVSPYNWSIFLEIIPFNIIDCCKAIFILCSQKLYCSIGRFDIVNHRLITRLGKTSCPTAQDRAIRHEMQKFCPNLISCLRNRPDLNTPQHNHSVLNSISRTLPSFSSSRPR